MSVPGKYVSGICTAVICLLCSSSLFSQRTDSISVYFKPNQFHVDSIGLSALQLLQRDKLCVYELRGYTDTTNTNAYNKALSKKRVDDVINILKSWNIPFCTDYQANYDGETTIFGKQLADNRVVIIKARKQAEPVIASPLPATPAESITDSLVISTNKILFYPDSYIIRPESLDYLNDLYKQLKRYNTGMFEIVGHVNYQSNRPASQLKDIYKLSEERAKAVADLLIEKGISKDRILFRGVGNSQPVFANPQTVEQRMQNMRVEIYIHY